MIDEREAFVSLVRRLGRSAPLARVLDIQPHLEEGETDCWTHAYTYARRTGARYVEGICVLPSTPEKPNLRIAVHAWCEEDTPLGSRVVEFTGGYEQARHYRGVVVDLDSDMAQRAEWEGKRVSVVELDLATSY